MAKTFLKLAQTEVFIQTDGSGGGFNCPMLPVGKMPEMNRLSEDLAKAVTPAEMDAIRRRMINLAGSVFPEDRRAGLERLDIARLAELIAYLMFGDPADDDQPRDDAKKN